MTLSSHLELTPVVSGSIASPDSATNVVDISSPALSGDGHLLAFVSSLALDAHDTNGVDDVYIKDFASNTLRRVGISLGDGLPDVSAKSLSLSDNGRYMAFIAEDSRVYVKDLQDGWVTAVSATQTGERANSFCTSPKISADGHFVTFLSKATNLSSVDTHARFQAYEKNMLTGALSLVSCDANGAASLADARAPALSADGRFVAFNSNSTNLVDVHGNGNRKVFLKDMQSGTISLGVLDRDGRPPLTGGDHAQISADGRFLLFDTTDTLLVSDHGGNDVYVRNLKTGILQLVSPGEDLAKNYGGTFADAISADGRYVLFHAIAVDLVGNDDPLPVGSNAVNQYYVRDLTTDALTRLSSDTSGKLANGANFSAVLAGDGQSAVFLSDATNLAGPSGKETLYHATLGAAVLSPNGEFDDFVAVDHVLSGGDGDDSYLVRSGNTKVVELAGQGHDRVVSDADNFILPANVEDFQLGGNLAIHGTGNDMDNVMRGNSRNNLLEGKGGNDLFYSSGGSDTFDGGAGIDTVFYATLRSDVTLHQLADGRFDLVINSASDGNHDTFQNVERVRLGDVSVALDINGNGGQAYRIYQAAFNRTPDQGGLGFWINAMDTGASLDQVAQGFVDSAEFRTLYGEHPANADIVSHMYQNVLHRAPDAGGAAFWQNVLDNRLASVASVLAQFSESPENKAALVGVMQNGIDFIPFA
jgi:Tol biopolymer transport system component